MNWKVRPTGGRIRKSVLQVWCGPRRIGFTVNKPLQRIRVGHSPDPDDAFMFYALAKGKIDTGRYRFEHELVDIETLNRRALDGELELTALSVHAYAYLSDRYVLCSCGASMGDRYGPMVVARRGMTLDELAAATIAVPGLRTTAYLALRLAWAPISITSSFPSTGFSTPWPTGQYEGRPVDAGLVIHEGQLTYADQRLRTGRRHGPVVVRAHRPAACRWAPTASARTWAPRRSATCIACCARASSTAWSTATRRSATP